MQCNSAKTPTVHFSLQKKALLQAIWDCRSLLREANQTPTKCFKLVMGDSDFVGVKDASTHGVGGVIVGDKKACIPTVFRLEWPNDIETKSSVPTREKIAF
jgi:hypothetical protein